MSLNIYLKRHLSSIASYHSSNQGKSAARFRHQAAAWIPDMFCNFYLVKSHNIANNSATAEAREKMSADSESSEFCHILTKFENYQI